MTPPILSGEDQKIRSDAVRDYRSRVIRGAERLRLQRVRTLMAAPRSYTPKHIATTAVARREWMELIRSNPFACAAHSNRRPVSL